MLVGLRGVGLAALLGFAGAPGEATVADTSGAAGAGGEEELLQELLQVLEEETEIATRTKMNVDFVPGMVSVLHGVDLERLGVRTVWEAMGLVPGVETTMNNFGNPLNSFRGVGFDVLTSHFKLLVDGAPVNQSFVGANHAAVMMPVELVDRIEVIRGPGSAVYGEFALSGVVNVVTRHAGNRVYATGGQFGTRGGGAHFAHQGKGLSVSGILSGWESDGADTFVAEDAIRRQQPAVSLTPGSAAEDEVHESQFLTLRGGDFALRFQRQRRRDGLYFGVRSLPPDPDARDQNQGYLGLDARQQWTLASSLDLQVHFGYNRGDRLFSEQFLPPGFRLGPPGGAGPVFANGQRLSSFHRERRFDPGLTTVWRAPAGHQVMLQLAYADIEIIDTYQEANFDLVTGSPLPSFRRLTRAQSTAVAPGAGRTIRSAALQDQFRVHDRLTATLGLRYDDFSDVGDRLTPRAAAVWRPGGPHLVKVQYSEAFRPPALQSLHLPAVTRAGQQGNPNLRPETIRTYEFGYIHRRPDFVGRATLYDSTLEDFIGLENRTNTNLTDFHFRGLELEADWRFRRRWRALANLSWFDATDKRGLLGHEGSSDRLANLALMREFGPALMALRVLAVGDRPRRLTDQRAPLDGYTCVDLTLTLASVRRLRGLGVRLGGRNLFDQDVRMPALPDTYLTDLKRPGRTWWGQLSYTL
jgi:iron complex outermembrane receptor protein